jgi:hypothetical protein
MPSTLTSPNILERALFWGTLLLGVVPALVFAGRPMWVIAPVAMAIGVLLAITAARRLRQPSSSWTWSGGLLTGAAILWALVIIYALLQALMTGPSVGVWADAAALTSQATPSRRSFNPGATLNGALRFAAYGGLCLLAYWTCRGRKEGWAVLWAIAAAATLAAVYGIAGKVLGWETVLWREKLNYSGYATGPFENRNTFATFLAIGITANIALFARALRKAGLGDFVGTERVRQILEFGTRQGILMALPMLAMAGASLMTGSRAGFAVMALAAGISTVAIAIRWGGGRTLLRVISAVGSITVIISVLWVVGGSQTAERAAKLEDSASYRLEIYRDTARAIEQGPSGGYGLGAFPEAFHRYKSTELVNDWRRAHNSYLELALEISWPMAIIAVLAITLVIAAATRGLWTRYRSAPFAAAATASAIAAAAHSLVDFPLQEPGIALTLALLLGAAAAQADGRNGSS